MSIEISSILINGVSTNQISVLDRGIQYGDGLFETINVIAGKPQYWQQHIARLLDGCHRLKIQAPDVSVLQVEAESLYKRAADCVLKIIVTRGESNRGYAIVDSEKSTRVLITFPVPHYAGEYWLTGIAVKVCNTRLGLNPSLAGIKHLNRLEQVLAHAEWKNNDFQEGLMLDINDNVIEGTKSNIFCVKNGELITPDLSLNGVKGIMREQIIKVAQENGINVIEMKVKLNDVMQADEIFFCNSLIGVWPVRLLDDHVFKSKKMTQKLVELLRKKQHGIENVA